MKNNMTVSMTVSAIHPARSGSSWLMKHLCLIAILASPSICNAQSNSSGPESPIVVGSLIRVSDDGKTFTVKQHGDIERKLLLPAK